MVPENSSHLILVVDDDNIIRSLICRMLKKDNYLIEEAETGKQGLAAFKKHKPDLVLLDAMMPEMDGFTACEHIKALPQGEQTPVLIITALQDNKSVDLAFAAGATDFITKPVHWGVLRQRVRRLLREKEAEQSLRESEERFRAVSTSAQDAIVIMDNDGLISFWNESAERMFGYSKTEALETNLHQHIVPNAYYKVYQKGFRAFQETGRFADMGAVLELTGLKKGGEEFPVEISLSSVMLHGQWHAVGIIRDISRRKRSEEIMVASQKLADLGTLAAGVAHEINSPLQVITGVSKSLANRLNQNRLEPEFLSRKLDVIHRNGWRCAEIVRSLKTYGQASSSQIYSCDLNEIVEDTLLLIEHQLKSWSNIIIDTNLLPNLPLLQCDRNQISQIIINLLTNARDAMPDSGHISISTSYNQSLQKLTLQVTDTGCGIPESLQTKIFDPFFTTKAIGQGTGLGLSILAGIVRAHGGEINVHSTLNQGTTFTCYFPDSSNLETIAITDATSKTGRFGD